MDRRTLLKALVLTPFARLTAFASPALKVEQTSATSGSHAYVLLHGLFFMEYQGQRLVVTAPDVADHDYRVGEPEDGAKLGNAPTLPSNVIDWTASTLRGDGACSAPFPPEILQFSKNETGVGDLTNDPSFFRFRLLLQCPLKIIALRRGVRKDLPILGGSIAQSIQKHSSPSQVGMVTCLQYNGSIPGSTSTNRIHFYAQPDCELGPDHINHAWQSSQKLFGNTKFDLQVDVTKNPPKVNGHAPVQDDPSLNDLLNPADENSLSEILLCITRLTQRGESTIRSINVANCGQFGVLNP